MLSWLRLVLSQILFTILAGSYAGGSGMTPIVPCLHPRHLSAKLLQNCLWRIWECISKEPEDSVNLDVDQGKEIPCDEFGGFAILLGFLLLHPLQPHNAIPCPLTELFPYRGDHLGTSVLIEPVLEEALHEVVRRALVAGRPEAVAIECR